jgi:hypothetical protein
MVNEFEMSEAEGNNLTVAAHFPENVPIPNALNPKTAKTENNARARFILLPPF